MADSWKIYASTFNCAKSFPFGDEDKVSAILGELLPDAFNHDVYALGFQELISTWEASFPSLSHSMFKTLEDTAVSYINKNSSLRQFRLVEGKITGAVGLIVLLDERINIEKVTTSSFKCGFLNSSLKGAASICCSLKRPDEQQETFTFICSHLNANEGVKNAELRVSNYATIMSACATDFRMTRFKESHVFHFGDLNFRVHGWQDLETNYSNAQTIRNLLEEHDELKKLREQGLVFEGFDESPVTFPPTYKLLISKESTYDVKRTPSWCDRVLFRHYSPKTYNIVSYKSISRSSCLQFSDHQAVVLDIEVPSNFSAPPLEIPVSISSPQQLLIGDVTDMMIGYVGWGIARKAHYWIAVILGLIVVYKLI